MNEPIFHSDLTMEQIENILERATLDQLKIILRFLRNIIK